MESTENSELLLALAQRVKELRAEKGVSQDQMSADTGINVGRIEQGKRDISFTTLKKICEYFGVTMSVFLSSID